MNHKTEYSLEALSQTTDICFNRKLIDYLLFEIELMKITFNQKVEELYTELLLGQVYEKELLKEKELLELESSLKKDFEKLVSRNLFNPDDLTEILRSKTVDEKNICYFLESSLKILHNTMEKYLNNFGSKIYAKIDEIFIKNILIAFDSTSKNRLNWVGFFIE